MNEFVPIPGFEEYLISPQGIIMWDNRGTFVRSKFTSAKYDKYPRVLLRNKKHFVHRLLAKTFIPNPNNYEMINHIDGDKFNYRLDNLEWCDNDHNMAHAKANGLLAKGTRIHTNKLDEIQVKTIFYCREVKPKHLAKYFGIHRSGIQKIHDGETWKHLKLVA